MENNKRNILYFEANSMLELYEKLNNWQVENKKRFLSLNILQENSKFACIALTNPTEVIITDRFGSQATCKDGVLWVHESPEGYYESGI